MKLILIKIYPLCHGFSLYSSLSFIFFLYHTCKNLKEVVDQGVAFSAYYVMQTAACKQVRYVICCTTAVSTINRHNVFVYTLLHHEVVLILLSTIHHSTYVIVRIDTKNTSQFFAPPYNTPYPKYWQEYIGYSMIKTFLH